jgi:DNA-damage-inducible protein J
MLHVRVDDDTKNQASQALESMGLTLSDAVRLFLRRVVIEQAFPLELKVPNTQTLAAMGQAEEILNARRTRFASSDALFEALENDNDK